MMTTTERRRSPFSIVLVPLAVAVMLFEVYLWRGLKALMARLGRLPAVARMEAHIARLSPGWAALTFVVPGLVLAPFKIAALWAMANGHVLGGLLVLVAAKLTATALFARLYTLCKPALMQVGWFVRLHDYVTRARLWAHARLEAWAPWRLARRVLARVRATGMAVISAVWSRLTPMSR